MAGFSLDMAINRTNVGRQMVGDLGNFVGRDLGKQFMSKPQKLAEGDSVAEEIAFETVSFTDDITGKTKTFKYNPETHHPPDSSGRMRKKGVNVSDVALQGGTTFFDTAELVEQPAAPAAPAAPKKERPPIPINPETDADEAERQEQRDQLFRPLEHGYASPKGALMDYKISEYTDPLVRIASKGLIDPDPDDRLRRYMGKKPDRYVRSYEGRPEDYGKLVLDPRDQTLGLDKETIDRELAGMRGLHGLGEKDRFSDQQVKDLLWSARHNVFHKQKPSVAGGDSGDPVDEAEPEKTSIVKGPEPIDPHEDVGGSTAAGEKLIRDSVAEKLVTKKPPEASAAKPTSFPNPNAQGYFDEAGKWHPEELTQDQKDIRSGKTTLKSIAKELQDQAILNPAEKGLTRLININAGAGDARPPESDWSRGFDGLTFGSEEAYLDTIQSEIIGRLDEEDRQRTFERAQVAVNQGDPVLAGQIIAAGSEDQPDAPSDWDETVDYGSPFRKGGLVQLAHGGGPGSHTAAALAKKFPHLAPEPSPKNPENIFSYTARDPSSGYIPYHHTPEEIEGGMKLMKDRYDKAEKGRRRELIHMLLLADPQRFGDNSAGRPFPFHMMSTEELFDAAKRMSSIAENIRKGRGEKTILELKKERGLTKDDILPGFIDPRNKRKVGVTEREPYKAKKRGGKKKKNLVNDQSIDGYTVHNVLANYL